MTDMIEAIQELEKKAGVLSGAHTNKECRDAALAAYKLTELACGSKELEISDEERKSHIDGILYVTSVIGEIRSKCNGFVQGSFPRIFLEFLHMALAGEAHNKRKRAEVWKKYCRDTIDVFWPEDDNG